MGFHVQKFYGGGGGLGCDWRAYWGRRMGVWANMIWRVGGSVGVYGKFSHKYGEEGGWWFFETSSVGLALHVSKAILC